MGDICSAPDQNSEQIRAKQAISAQHYKMGVLGGANIGATYLEEEEPKGVKVVLPLSLEETVT